MNPESLLLSLYYVFVIFRDNARKVAWRELLPKSSCLSPSHCTLALEVIGECRKLLNLASEGHLMTLNIIL